MNPSSNSAAGVVGYTNSNIGPTNTSSDSSQAGPTKNVRTISGKVAQLGEIGKSGTYIYSGIITNEDYNLELTRFEGIRKYEIMRRSDSTIAAMLRAVKLPIEATNWFISPASEEPQDVEAADLMRQELFDRSVDFQEVISDALLMLDFGYSANEKVLEYAQFTPTNGTARTIIGLKKLAFRKHRSIYKWETVDHQPGITQYVPGGTYSIPLDKMTVFTFNKEGDNYEGIPILRQVYKDWDIKDKLILINAIRHERQGLGIIQVIAPADANQDDVDRVIANARAARASEESVFQSEEGYIVEFMDMKAGSGQLTNIVETIEYHDKQIMLSVLAQFIMLGQKSKGSSGSRALSEDQSRLFELGLEGIAKTIVAAINKTIIQPLCDYNFSNLKGKYPKLEHDKIGDENIVVIAQTVASLLTANGITMDPDTEQSLRTLLHLPDLPEDIRENYADRLINSGKMNLPDPQSPAQQALAAQAQQQAGTPASDAPGAKDKGNTHITAKEDPLETIRKTKAMALELLAHEYDSY